jgi:hypothetical protein
MASMQPIDYLIQMQDLDRLQRREFIIRTLVDLGIPIEEQVNQKIFTLGSRIRNYVVPSNTPVTQVIGAHYDPLTGKKSVIDNLTGVSILLYLASQHSEELSNLGTELVFFDAEEYFKIEGTDKNSFLGSKLYLSQRINSPIERLFNLDCVVGDYPIVWPVEDEQSQIYLELADIANQLGCDIMSLQAMKDRTTTYNSDHKPFVESGISAVTITCVNEFDFDQFQQYKEALKWNELKEMEAILKRIEILTHLDGYYDNVSEVSPQALLECADLVYGTVRNITI